MFHSMPKAQKLLEYNQFKLQIENTHNLVSYRFPVIFGGIHLARTYGWKCTYQFPAISAGIKLTRAEGWKYTWPRFITISCNVRRNLLDSERVKFTWNAKSYQNTFNWIKVVQVHITPSSRKLSGRFSCKICLEILESSKDWENTSIHIALI